MSVIDFIKKNGKSDIQDESYLVACREFNKTLIRTIKGKLKTL